MACCWWAVRSSKASRPHEADRRDDDRQDADAEGAKKLVSTPIRFDQNDLMKIASVRAFIAGHRRMGARGCRARRRRRVA
jgi:hypothetical protein